MVERILLESEPLDVHEESVLRYILMDVIHKPILGVLRRRGEYTFVIGSDDDTCLSRALKKQHTIVSKLTLGPNENFCTSSVLERVIRVACIQAGATFVSTTTCREESRARYAYTIRY